MKINHDPWFNTTEVIDHYSEKDGVDIKYVCTTALKNDTIPVDVFYRETPHPEFGNRYFGLYITPFDGKVYVCDADYIEELEFGMLKDTYGVYHYSQHRHDMRPVKVNVKGEDIDGAIDGGRAYVRTLGSAQADTYIVKDGEFVEVA